MWEVYKANKGRIAIKVVINYKHSRPKSKTFGQQTTDNDAVKFAGRRGYSRKPRLQALKKRLLER
jgi:hypothetical protein